MASSLHYVPFKNTSGGGGRKPLTDPVSVSVSAVVCAQPPAAPPNFREQKESRLSGTLRFDSHREWRSLSPLLVSFHFRRVSVGTKTCLLILKAASEVVCTEPFRAVVHSNISKHRADAARAPAPSVHHTDVITHNVCYRSYSGAFYHHRH